MKLLVVEDEVPTLAFLKRGLTEEGFAVDVAADAGMAEEHIALYEYGAILLDMMLPGGDGFGLCETSDKTRIASFRRRGGTENVPLWNASASLFHKGTFEVHAKIIFQALCESGSTQFGLSLDPPTLSAFWQIFTRYHQLNVVQRVEAGVRASSSGKNHLIQQSAGRGKSNSIAKLAHGLSSLHGAIEAAPTSLLQAICQ